MTITTIVPAVAHQVKISIVSLLTRVCVQWTVDSSGGVPAAVKIIGHQADKVTQPGKKKKHDIIKIYSQTIRFAVDGGLKINC